MNMVFGAVVPLIVCALAACSADTKRDSGLPAPPLLLISLDGFRHDYLQQTELPALQRLAGDGLRADSLMHVFPTKTFTTHYALATGLYAEGTGVVANSMWDPQRKARFSLGNRDAVSDGYWYDGEPIWNTVVKAGGIAATYFWPGSEAQINGIRPNHFKPYAGDTPHDQRVDQVLTWLDFPDAKRPDFLTLYFSAVDSAGHRHGPGAPETIAAMHDVDRALARLIEGLEARGLFGQMHILVTSDHGMYDIDLQRYVMLDDFIDLSRVNVSDWGPAAQVWTIDGGPSATELAAAIDRSHPGIRRVWTRGNGPARYRFDRHQRIPDLTIEAEPGWMISNRPYYAGMQLGTLNGMHGWDPAWHPMHGILIAHGPAFRAGDRLPAARAVDLYALMAELLSINPAPNAGTLAPFTPLFESDEALQPVRGQWQCPDWPVPIQVSESPGLAALHWDERVLPLPRVGSASGARYADADSEFWKTADSARMVIEGQVLTACRPVATG